MYLEKEIKNRYTVGKVLRSYKKLRKPDPTGHTVPMPKELQQYTNELLSKGLEVRNLAFAHFKTKNGLTYPGLIATEKILSNTILVKVPVQSLLTTRDAFLSDIQKVFVENAGYYAKQFSSDWEDRILLTFLLYEYQKGNKSKWFNLIRNLPKDIDYAIFWNEAEMKLLEDDWFVKHIIKEKQKFERDCGQLMKILKNYPEFFNQSIIKKDNIIWIHTHLVTRCFGKYFQYTTMVPFAELFNHQCTDVYYSMYYKPGNAHDKDHEEFYDEKEISENQMDECESSDGSYDAEDFQESDEDLQLDSNHKKVKLEDYYQVDNEEILTDIKNMRIHIFTFINFSDSISIFYLEQSLEQIRKLAYLQQNQRKKKCEQIHANNVKYVKAIKSLYSKINRKYYTYGVRQKRSEKVQKKNEKGIVDKNGEEYFSKTWPTDKFDQFYMLCSTKDQFEKGSQVFFCYGRLPNKLLLMRYGIALEHNKYDHMFVKFDMTEEIIDNPDFQFALQDIKIKKYRKFKLKRTKICLQLITYFRIQKWRYGESIESIFSVTNWEKELEVLYETQQFYKCILSKYHCSIEENEKKLTDTKLGYHEHFALIYKLEQQRILVNQIKMIDYAIQIIIKVSKGGNTKQILTSEKQKEKLTMQIMMETYLKTFQIGK